MIVKYSTLQQLEVPKFTLCNPGSVYDNDNGTLSKVVGILTDHEAEEIVFNFNATSELNLRVNKIFREDPEENKHISNLYKAIQNRRLLFADNIGYFSITNIQDGYEGGISYKDITAKSIDIELAQKMIPYIENGTYPFLTDEIKETKGILNMIEEVLPLWKIGEVDDSVAEKWRTFEDIDTSLNCLGFLLENVQDAYECIIIFDIMTRTINVYSQDNYVRQTDIHITKEDLINSINITENADDLYTAIRVTGGSGDGGDVLIAPINPLGSNVIYDFSHYLDWMSDDLKVKVANWQKRTADSLDEYCVLNQERYDLLAAKTNYELEIERLNSLITVYRRCAENIVAESDITLVDKYKDVLSEIITQVTGIRPEHDLSKIVSAIIPESEDSPSLEHITEVHKEIINTVHEFESMQDACKNEIDGLNADISQLENRRDEISNSLSITKCFSPEEYSELCNYIYESSYNDEYIIFTDSMSMDERFKQMRVLYDRTKARLERISRPTQEFNLDVENFIFQKEFKKWSEQLETGCLINVELDTDDVAPLFLSNITVNYDDRSLNMTFGNRFNKFDPKSLFEDVLGDVTKSANTLNYVKEVLYPIKSGELNVMQEALETSRDLTAHKVLASDNEEVVIDDHGYTGRRITEIDEATGRKKYDGKQVKLIGRNLVFTDDAWETCKIAIGELNFDDESIYGINAEALIGQIILGNSLRIVDDEGNELFTVVDGLIKASIDGLDGRITELELRDGQIVAKVENEMGVFDECGLHIYKENTGIESSLNNEGLYVYKQPENPNEEKKEVLKADPEGVVALNIKANQYLIIGDSSRFEDYYPKPNVLRTGCFYIGEENKEDEEWQITIPLT